MYTKDKLTKMLIVTFCLCLAMSTSVFAVTYDTSRSFSSGFNGRGSVNGSSNGIYYTFDKGKTISLVLTDSSDCATGSYAVTLYK